MVLPWATFLVCNGNDIVTCNFVPFAANDVSADKLPLEMEPVACDNKTSSVPKPGRQTFVAPYSTDHSISGKVVNSATHTDENQLLRSLAYLNV